MKNAVVLGLGSNCPLESGSIILKPCEILEKACRALSYILSDIRFSSVYETEPMYLKEQSNFYNMAAAGFFQGSPLELLNAVQKIEADYGRCRDKERRFGPRTLDIDIELFSNLKIKTERLTIPHPLLYERPFILVPLLEILPFFADIKDRAFYERCLEQSGQDGVRKLCGSFKL
ncbi:2-amino-4-hydroxy-6-hydroxymethyldihydropteridine diphosphokinase [Treponema sp. OMZ 840]|uniref:2-amino-4-hydroxy-6- hydroxymethyldihydropteridine diphosphokinase n=1 Tax=Treponema sp. OMZ 840 TaxID=244313 RepID=UPI003D93379A